MKKKNYFQKHNIQELHFTTPQDIIENNLDSTPTSYPEGRTTLFNLASSVANSLHKQASPINYLQKTILIFQEPKPGSNVELKSRTFHQGDEIPRITVKIIP